MENQQPTPAPENMTQQQALSLLIQGVQFAQSKGVFSLADAGLLDRAVRVFTVQAPKSEMAEAQTTSETTTESAEVPTTQG